MAGLIGRPGGGDGEAAAYLDRVARIAGVIEGAACASERAKRLDPAVVEALHEAGLYRMLLPRELGGGELAPAAFAQVIEAVARLDASVAWCLCQASGCTMAAGYLPPEAAREVFGDPRAVLSWGPGPESRAVAAEGGYRVTGRWAFASGCRQATWLGGVCQVVDPDGAPRRRPDGAAETRTMLFPARRATIVDAWDVIGLRATGSDAFTVTDLFVPRAHSLSRDDPAERQRPGRLYCFPTTSLYASGFAGVALGLARRTLDDFAALARTKTPRGLTHPLRESPVVQAQLARAEARIGAARAWLLGSLGSVWEEVMRTGALDLGQRVRIRLAATHAIGEATAAVDFVYHAAGATAIFEGQAFERRFRDVHTVTQQVQGRDTHFETAGRFLLGLEPDTTFL